MLITSKLLPGFRLARILAIGILLLALFFAWRADRRDRAQLAADLATANQSIAQATARQNDRDAQLQQALTAIAAQKRNTAAPAQILRDLPKQMPLPTPITLQTPSSTTSADSAQSPAHPPGNKPGAATNPAPAVLPSNDLKPLYDFALDCKACLAKLATAQADLTDEKAKTAVLTRERDQAVRIGKGGSILRRIERATKWFLLGAAAGAIAAQARR